MFDTDTILDAGSELILYKTLERATHNDFENEKNIILIHGLTAHGKYLLELAESFCQNGCNVFLYNYNSYVGVSEPAKTLCEYLADLNDVGENVIKRNKVTFVAHSMGGLVARAFTYLPNACEYLRSIVTLGTPHCGVLLNRQWVKALIKWGEFITSAMPGVTNKDCASIRDLTGQSGILEELEKKNDKLIKIPLLSISGAKPWIDFGKGSFFNHILNQRLQNDILFYDQNDGLVPERSSNIERLREKECAPNSFHYNQYPEINRINHSNLVNNYGLSIKIIRWINTQTI